MEFWIACEEFRYFVDDSISVEAQKIYGKFVALKAPKEVYHLLYHLMYHSTV